MEIVIEILKLASLWLIGWRFHDTVIELRYSNRLKEEEIEAIRNK